MTSGTPTAVAQHERWMRPLPFGLLALATAAAVVANPLFEEEAADLRVLLGLAAATAAWMAVWTYAIPETRRNRQAQWIGRTACAFVLVWLNPLFAIFGFVGFLDVFDLFEGMRALPGAFVTAVMQAGSQSGGLPLDDLVQFTVFLALLALNFGLATFFSLLTLRLERESTERALTIEELARVNAELERTVAENTALHEQVVAQAREAGVREERQRLAREIHDTIAQGLAGVVAQLQASHDEPDPARRRDQVERASELARSALVEARRSVQALGPLPLERATLPEALDSLVGTWAQHHATKADLVVTGEAQVLHPEVEAALLRVTQESLSNVGKHARADRVGVTLSYVDGEVIVDVRDDGVGFDPDQTAGGAAAETGFGLRSMRQRAERLAGVLDVETAPGRGTAVSVRLPALEQEVP